MSTTLISAVLESKVWNYATVPVFIAQAALLHPYYEPNETYRTLRLALAPIIIYLVFTSQTKRMFQPWEDYMHINYAIAAIPTFHIICRALQFAFQRGPVLQTEVGRKKRNKPNPRVSGYESESTNTTCSDSTGVVKSPRTFKSFSNRSEADKLAKAETLKASGVRRQKKLPPPSWAELTKFSVNLVFSPRCLGTTWAPPPSVLSRAPKKSVAWFVLEEVVRLVANQICMIAVAVFAIPAAQHPRGAHGYITEVYGIPDSAFLRYASTYAFVSAFGAVGLYAFTILSTVWNLVEVLYYTLASRFLPGEWAPAPFDTTYYPAMFNNPQWRTSLTDFWGKAWQCVFRRDFMFVAEPLARMASPFGPLAMRLAGLMGAMLMSGIMHEWGLISIVDDIDWTFETTRFFLTIGVGIAIEATLKQLTGYKMSGIIGYAWTFGWMGFWGRDLLDIWMARGLGTAGVRYPAEYTDWSWARYLVPAGPILPDRLLDALSF